jgi:hypothetical protein
VSVCSPPGKRIGPAQYGGGETRLATPADQAIAYARTTVVVTALPPASLADADLENFRRVRLAVVPHERALTVAEMRAAAGPDTAHLLASRCARRCDQKVNSTPVARAISQLLP